MVLLPSIMPISVAVAVAIFVAREVLEGWRRVAANRRKRQAIRNLLAAECERNAWTISQLSHALKSVERVVADNWDEEQVYVERRAEVDRFVTHRGDKQAGSFIIPIVHQSTIERYLFDAASLDKRLFKKMIDAADAVRELQHVRSSLVRMVNDRDLHLNTFPNWALEQLGSGLIAAASS